MAEVKTIKRGELARHSMVPPDGDKGQVLTKTSDNDADLEWANLGALTGQILLGTSGVSINWGTGSPEGAVTANRGSTFHRTDGGASSSFYVKESNDGSDIGWVAK